MTKPKRIWATPFDEMSDGGTYCNAENRPTAPNCDALCYVRADLVKPLVEAADMMLDAFPIQEGSKQGVAYGALCEALASLAEASADSKQIIFSISNTHQDALKRLAEFKNQDEQARS